MQTDLKRVSRNLRQTMLLLPHKVGVVMVAWSKDRFKYQNWIDNYPANWQQRSKNTWTSKRKSRNDKGRALLVKTGRLRRSIRIMGTTYNSVTTGSDVPYARVHNEGVRMKFTQKVGQYTRRNRKKDTVVKAHDRKYNYKMPERRFMGESRYLNMQIRRLISAEINKAFRQ